MTIAKTRLGHVEGVEKDGSVSFLGIPFAAPPVGDLRWRAPAKASRWSGVFDATAYPQRSFQPPLPTTLGSRINPGAMSEDMLYLNIWTPGADGAKRPVLVYIHGGGFVSGSANDFDPTPFARKHDVVVVAMNYRLGIFGFIDLSRFGPEYKDSISLGFQDQIAALRWISENIADYGGDPGNISVNGVSAGAGAVLALMGAPSAKGLFHKAIAFSPAEIARKPPDLLGFFSQVLAMDDRATFNHLKSLSGEELSQLYTGNGATMNAAVDGSVIVQPADEAIRAGVNAVPMIVGTCIKEGTLLVPTFEEDSKIDVDKLLSDTMVQIGAGESMRYKEFLKDLVPDASVKDRMLRVWYDYFRSPTLRTAQALSAVDVNAWVYSFEVPTDHPFGPTHASDMAFSYNLFESDNAIEGEFYAFHRNTLENRRIASQWTDTIAQFMRTGDPNWQGFPHWPAYTAQTRTSMVLREIPMAVPGFDTEEAAAAYGLVR